MFALLVVGAAGSALNGLLQGLTVIRRGAAAAFVPTLVLNLLAGLVTLGLWGPQPLLLVTAVWALTQIIPPLVLVASRPELRRTFRDTGTTAEADSDHFAATGIVNAASVPIAYVFRERWAAPEFVRSYFGFGIVRFTEIGYQILYMVLASTPHRVNRLVMRLPPEAHRFRVVALMYFSPVLGVVSR